MWNVEFGTMNDFLCIGTYDGGIWAQSPQLAPIPQYTKAGLTWPTDGLYTWVRHYLMWNAQFNTFNDFCWIAVHDLGYLGQF